MGGKISRSKIELFIDCPRCFWLDVKHGIKRPEMVLAGNIGQVYDGILKGYFDKHRDDSTVPDPVASKGFKLYPAKDKLKRWRSCIEYHHKDHGITYWGKIDDLLIDSENRIVPFDFKTTLKTFSPEATY